jgi:hypothetical protein
VLAEPTAAAAEARADQQQKRALIFERSSAYPSGMAARQLALLVPVSSRSARARFCCCCSQYAAVYWGQHYIADKIKRIQNFKTLYKYK